MMRSRFFYVGEKYKLMSQLSQLFPPKIDTYFDAFVGGGSTFLNTRAKKYVVNDIDENIISLHRELSLYRDKKDELFDRIYKIIDDYGLTCSFIGKTIPRQLKIDFPKTYFAKFNKEAYVKLRTDINKESPKDPLKLYILLIYGFNHMLRFNKSGLFNLPVGNVDFNKNVANALENYIDFMRNNEVSFVVSDYSEFIAKQRFNQNDFIYFDPPYLISSSEYNKLWSEEQEIELYNLIDSLDSRGVMFGLSNMLEHKGIKNNILEEWSSRYNVYNIKSNYISFNDNSIKKGSREVYVTNYER